MSSFAQAGAVQAANDEDTLETQEWLAGPGGSP